MKSHVPCVAQYLLIVGWCCFNHATVVLGQVDPTAERLRPARTLYEADKWPRGPMRDGIPLGSLELEGWKGGPLRSNSGHLQRTFTAGDKAEKIVIEAFVGDSVEQAHQQLLSWLAGRQSTIPAPRAQDRELKIGDVAYLGLAGVGNQTIGSIAYVRGNVAVRIRNADPGSHPNIDLSTVARSLDEKIAAREALGDNAKPQAPTIEKLSPEKASVTAGEVVRLDVAVNDPQKGTPHLQWVVRGNGQGYVEPNQDNVWYLHTTGPGEISLALEVTGSTGTFASKETKISVLPRP